MIRDNRARKAIKITIDLAMVSIAYFFTYIMKYEESWHQYFSGKEFSIYLILFFAGYMLMGISKKSWTYFSSADVFKIAVSLFFSTAMLALNDTFIGYSVSKYMYVSIFTFSLSLFLLARYSFKMKRLYFGKGAKGHKKVRTLIVGAGEAGEHIVRENLNNPRFGYQIVGLIDDDPRKLNTEIYGLRVLGGRDKIKHFVEKMGVEEIVIAIPSADSKVIKEINEVATKSGAVVKILPAFDDMLENMLYIKQIRDVEVEDLLGRNEVKLDDSNISHLVEDKVVFVTGGAGSIGSELCRQIAKHKPKTLVSLDINENAIYFLELELKRKHPELNIISEICSVREREKLEWVFERYKPDLVFHAAAHKHVPLMEHNPEEAVKNNIFGTKNVAECADIYSVDRFVLVSTDKAVNPTNIMGATKRACELVVHDMEKKSKTKYMAVRFGNVLGSNGSVIPLFKKLIEEGKNLTLTHPDVTRYFMTIPEAARLVVEAGALGKGGEVFILDMGKSIKIMDLAKNLIELSGLTLGEDIDIEIVGLRPGEKLYEELLYDVNAAIKTENKKIFIAKLQEEKVELEYHLERLRVHIEERDVLEIKEEMKRFVSSYKEPDHHFESSEELKVKNEDLEENKDSVEIVPALG